MPAGYYPNELLGVDQRVTGLVYPSSTEYPSASLYPDPIPVVIPGSGLYAAAPAAFAASDIDWLADDIRVVLLDGKVYPGGPWDEDPGRSIADLTTHVHLDDIPSEARLAVSGSLTGKTWTDGAAGADDITITGLPDYWFIWSMAIYQHTGTEATSRLIAYITFWPRDRTTMFVRWAPPIFTL